MDLQLSDWANVAEIAGTFVIALSLVFVGLQIRVNAVATQAATYQEAVGHEISILLAMAATPECAVNQNTYLTEPQKLEKDDYQQARWIFLATMRLWENLYHQWRAGTLSPGGWAAREPLVKELLLRPPATELMEFANFSGPFMEYVKRVRLEQAAPDSHA